MRRAGAVLQGTMPRVMRIVPPVLFAAALCAFAQESAPAGKAAEVVTVASRTAGMRHMDGLLPMDWDAKAGKLYLEVTVGAEQRSAEILYTDSLPFGTGSNDLGLDRGQTADGRIVRFERFGPKLLLVEPNEAFRTSSKDAAEQLAVRQSFPESVLWGFRVEAETAQGGGGGGAGRCDGVFCARRPWGVGGADADEAGCVPGGRDAVGDCDGPN